MQQTAQGVQAMLVTCISHYDQSIPHAANILLDTNCPVFFGKLGDVLPNLLKPAGGSKSEGRKARSVRVGSTSVLIGPPGKPDARYGRITHPRSVNIQ
jgi:hypothetical protein